MKWWNLNEHGWRLTVTEHPRNPKQLVYDLREQGAPLPGNKMLYEQLVQGLSEAGFIGREIPVKGQPLYCIRAAVTPARRALLAQVLPRLFPHATMTEQPLERILWGVNETLLNHYRSRYESSPSQPADQDPRLSRGAALDQPANPGTPDAPLSEPQLSRVPGSPESPSRAGHDAVPGRAGGLDGQSVDAGPGDRAAGDPVLGSPEGQLAPEAPALGGEFPEPEEDLFVPDLADISWETFRPEERATGNGMALQILTTLRESGQPATRAERRLLSRYVGWGALGRVLDGYPVGWARTARTALESYFTARSALVPSSPDWKAAQSLLHSSILNAHYTAPAVVSALWDALIAAGFQGGRLLEPSAGAGIFVGLMPEALRRASQITAVELDPMAADVLRALYPEITVREGGFEDHVFPKGYFDGVITNVPFSNTPIYDKQTNRRFASLHDYFIERSISLLRPGGVAVFLTSAFTMDKIADTTRSTISRSAKLLGAVRLPANSQSAQAGTEVVEDALVFRALYPGEAPDTAWRDSRKIWVNETAIEGRLVPVVQDLDEDAARAAEIDELMGVKSDQDGRTGSVNAWYWNHPEYVLGRWARNGRFGGMLSVESRPQDPPLAEAIRDSLRSQILDQAVEERGVTRLTHDQDESATWPRITLPQESEWMSGMLCLWPEGEPPAVIELGLPDPETEGSWRYRVIAPLHTKNGAILQEIIAIRDALKQVFSEDSAPSRVLLNATYDAFVAQNGFLSAPKNRRLFQSDPYAGRLLALEVRDDETQSFRKADIFARSLHEGAEPPKPGTMERLDQALVVAYTQYGHLGSRALASIESLLTPEARGDTDVPIADLLIQEGLAFRDPLDEEMIFSASYLSGQIADKIIAARAAAHDNPNYHINVKALEAVLPPPLQAGDIMVGMGAGWIPTDVVDEYLRSLESYGTKPKEALTVYHLMSGWSLTHQGEVYLKSVRGGTRRAHASTLLTNLLKREPTQVYDTVDGPNGEEQRVLNRPETQAAQEASQVFQVAFQSFLWADEARTKRLCDLYNRQFNSYVSPRYTLGDHMPPIPGLSPSLALYPTQKNMILRGLCEKRGDIAHDVGMGKTFTQIALAHELRRLGIVKHPMIVVKKSTLIQFAQSAQQAFPQNRYLVMTAEDMKPARRARFLAQAMTQNCDAIIVTHETFRNIPVSAFMQESVLLEEISTLQGSLEDMNASNVKNYTRKQIAKRIATLKARLREVMNGSQENITFDQDLVIDGLIVDEAHLFKNEDSARSLDLQIKAEAVRRVRGDSYGVFLATATPVSNNLNEIHRMMRYTHPDLLLESGIATVESFRSVFVGTRTAWEPHHAGAGWVLRSRDTLINVPEVMTIFLSTTDRRTVERDAPGIIIVPQKIEQTVEVPMTEIQQEMMERIAARALGAETDEDGAKYHVFSLMNAAALTSCDARLLPAKEVKSLESYRAADMAFSGKMPAVADNAARVYHETSGDKGTQMVFLDMGVPGGTNQIDLYEDLIKRLVAAGVPRAEIATIHEAKTDAQRAELFAQVNAGLIRILLGSTGKMAEGVNAQERMVAIHVASPPWRPDIVEQMVGRLVRQGNRNSEGRVFFYAAVSQIGAVSPDAFRYQLLQTKIATFTTLLRGEYTGRTYDPEVSMSMGEIAATASGNPLVMEKFKREGDVAKAEASVRFLLNERQNERFLIGRSEFQETTQEEVRAFHEAMPIIESPEVWFSCDKTQQPIAEIGGRQEMLDYARARTKTENETVICRNTPVVISGIGRDMRLAVRMKCAVVDPDSSQRNIISVARFSSFDGLIKRLSPERRAALIQQCDEAVRVAQERRQAALAAIAELETHRLPEAEAALRKSREELRAIEQRLLDQEEGKLVERTQKRGVKTLDEPDSGDGNEAAVMR